MNPKIWAVIPAAGGGSRYGGDIPKQYLHLAGKPMLAHSLELFMDCAGVHNIVVALARSDKWFASLDTLAQNPQLTTVTGGQSRAQSVLNALESLRGRADDNDFILVHDAARPLLHSEDLASLIRIAGKSDVGGILAAPVADTLKRAAVEEPAADTTSAPSPESCLKIHKTLSRENIWAAQTPQMFRFSVLYPALQRALQNHTSKRDGEITDEASACEVAGYQPLLIPAQHSNFKVTRRSDFDIAEIVLQQRAGRSETGQGGNSTDIQAASFQGNRQ